MMGRKSEGGVYWKDVLNEIYTFAPDRYGWGKKGWTDDHKLAKEVGISGDQLMKAMCFLEYNKLVEYDASEGNWINLTEKGFNVAFQIEKNRSDNRMTKTMLVFTAIIAISTVFNFLASLEIYKDPLFQVILVLFLSISLLIIVYFNLLCDKTRRLKTKE